MGTSKRERQKQARHEKIEELRRMEQRQATRREGLLIGLAVAAFLAFAIGYSVLTADDDGDDQVATVDDRRGRPTGRGDRDRGRRARPTTTEPPPRPPSPRTSRRDTECPPSRGRRATRSTSTAPSPTASRTGVDYQARFVTDEGESSSTCCEDEMPNTVNNFVSLARYGYYDDTLLFRTDPSTDIIQGGSPHTQDNADQRPRLPSRGRSCPSRRGLRRPVPYARAS